MPRKAGLGIKMSSRAMLTPCPSMVNKFFKDQMNYTQVPVENKSNKNQFLVRYTQILNHPDHPMFPELANIVCISNLIVDFYSGAIIDHYFTINHGSAIRKYTQCPVIKELAWMFRWHSNLLHISREYLDGGWMQRGAIQKEIEATKSKYIILNTKGFGDLVEKSKPEDLNSDVGDVK